MGPSHILASLALMVIGSTGAAPVSPHAPTGTFISNRTNFTDDIQLAAMRRAPIAHVHYFVLEHYGKSLPLRSQFNLSEAAQVSSLNRTLIVKEGDDNIVSQARIDDVGVVGLLAGGTAVTVTSTVTLDKLPGKAVVWVSLRDSSGSWMTAEHHIHVVGISLYKFDTSGQLKIYSGRGALPVVLRRENDGALSTTLKASVLAGTDSTVPSAALSPSVISLDVGGENWNAEELLPWSASNCRNAMSKETLDTLCALAFSPDYKSFSLRVPPGRPVHAPITVTLEWPGYKAHTDTWTINGNSALTGLQKVPQSLTSDRVTSFVVKSPPSMSDESSGSGLKGWQLGLIVTGVLILLVPTLSAVWWRRHRVTGQSKPTSWNPGDIPSSTSPGASFPSGKGTLGDSSTVKLNTSPATSSNQKPGRTPTDSDSKQKPYGTSLKQPPKEKRTVRSFEYWGTTKGPEKSDIKAKIAGAAERFRLLDLLHGPSTRGLVGRNGKPVENDSSDEED